MPELNGDRDNDWKMDRSAFEVFDLGDEARDHTYWLTRTPEERLAAVEFIRQSFYGKDIATQRIQRVLEITDHQDE